MSVVVAFDPVVFENGRVVVKASLAGPKGSEVLGNLERVATVKRLCWYTEAKTARRRKGV